MVNVQLLHREAACPADVNFNPIATQEAQWFGNNSRVSANMEADVGEQLYSVLLAAFNWETVAVSIYDEWRAVEPLEIWLVAWEFAAQNYWLRPVVDFWFGPNNLRGEVMNFSWM